MRRRSRERPCPQSRRSPVPADSSRSCARGGCRLYCLSVRSVWKKSLLFFVPAAIALTGGFLLLHASQTGADLRVLEAGQLEIVRAVKAAIVAEIAAMRADLLIVADPPVLALDDSSRALLAERFAAVARHKGVYDQIRLIDARGREVVRVNYGAGIVSVAPPAALQDRSGAYYFQEAIRLRRGEIYMSPFDLSVERSAPEVPLKPAIRVATPAVGSDGRTAGIIVINYLGDHMLRMLRLSTAKTPGEMMLLNSDGYWLAAPSPEDEWGFLIEERRGRTLALRYPEAALRIYSALTGQARLAEGLFTFDTVFPLNEGWRSAPLVTQDPVRTSVYLWKIVSRVPPEAIAQSETERLRRTAPIYAVALLALAFGSVLLAQEVTRRREHERQARASEERRKRLLERIRDAYFEMDGQGRLTEVSAASLLVFGYPQDQMVGRTLQEVGADGDLLERLAEHGSVADLQVAVRGPDGNLRHCSVNAWTVESPGEPRRFVGTAREITERLRLEEHLRQSQRLESVGRLAGGIAHDFNNLLTAVIGYADLILSSEETSPEVMESAGEIHRSAERAASLTRQLLAFSRRQVMQPRIVDLNPLVAEMARMLQRIIGEQVRLWIATQSRPAQVRADPSQIEQVIVNLAINAAEAMPGGGTLTIETSSVTVDEPYGREHAGMQPGAYVCLTVSDTGRGMTREVLDHIFEPFFTTKEVGKGSGLGLATVYGIVKQTGGYIWVDSIPSRGSTFRIYFPPAAGRPDHSVAAPAPDVARGGSERILLVEDDPVLRRMTLAALRKLGYTVTAAADAAEALSIVEADARFDLLVTDVVMPGMSGRDLAERLARRIRGIRILFVSGYGSDTVGLGSAIDSTNFLQKPYSLGELTQRIRKLLGRDQDSQLSLPL